MNRASAMADSFAAALQASPGRALPTLRSSRREWAPALARGKPARVLPTLLSSLYTLCGGAHHLAARHAVAAATGAVVRPGAADHAALRGDTLREHLRRIWLDWPGAAPLPGDAPSAALALCPLLRDAQAVEDSRAWIEEHVLGMPAAAWLAAWESSPEGFVRAWADTGLTWPARWLRAAQQTSFGWNLRCKPLAVHAATHELEHVAAELRQNERFALQPLWHGRAAETGPWTRLADPLRERAGSVYQSAFMRLASRVADIAQLLGPRGAQYLAQGAITPAPFEGIAYVEMARGLLIHWVRLEMGRAPGEDATVAACRVLAPTEWNFHPSGAMARVLATLPADSSEARVRLLAAAFDPCVPVVLASTGQGADVAPQVIAETPARLPVAVPRVENRHA